MLSSDTKRQAYAAMDDAESFQLVVANEAPHGDVVLPLAHANSVAELKPAVTLTRKMARTFFAGKLQPMQERPEIDGPAALYLICVPPELDADAIELLSEDGAFDPR